MAIKATSSGSIDGRPVSFTYQRKEDGRSGTLTWTEQDDQVSEPKSTTLHPEDVVILTAASSTKDAWTLLYVEPNPAADKESTACPLMLKTATITGLPHIAIENYSTLGPEGGRWVQSHHQQQKTSLHIIISIGSGTGLASAFFDSIVRPTLDTLGLKAGNDYTVHTTDSEFSVINLTKAIFLPAALRGEQQSIALLSGDGGILDVVNTLLSASSPLDLPSTYATPHLVLLPLGTGNALCHSAGISSHSNSFGLSTWLRGSSSRPLPLFRATFSTGARYLTNQARDREPLRRGSDGVNSVYGAVVCSWALHAGLVADSDTPEFRKFGRERFSMAAKEAVFPADGSKPHEYRGRVSILPEDDSAEERWQTIEEDAHAYLLATFMSQLERGFLISPESQPLDGRLRIIHFPPLDGGSGQAVMDLMTKAFTGGKHVEDPRVRYETARGLRIEFEETEEKYRRICVDGKIVAVEEGGWVEVRNDGANQREVIRVVLP